MQIINDDIRAQLLANGARSAADESFDPPPVVKLFTPDAGATWLLTELDPAEPDIAFGLWDLGVGCPELGTVRLSEIEAVRGAVSLPAERDLFFAADRLHPRLIAAAQRQRAARGSATGAQVGRTAAAGAPPSSTSRPAGRKTSP